jgi:hypothetical protein
MNTNVLVFLVYVLVSVCTWATWNKLAELKHEECLHYVEEVNMLLTIKGMISKQDYSFQGKNPSTCN